MLGQKGSPNIKDAISTEGLKLNEPNKHQQHSASHRVTKSEVAQP